MSDLKLAEECIELMRRYGTHDGHKVGMVTKQIRNKEITYAPGQIVLYSPSPSRDESIAIELPMESEELERNRMQGTLKTTFGRIENVPSGYVISFSVY